MQSAVSSLNCGELHSSNCATGAPLWMSCPEGSSLTEDGGFSGVAL